MNFGTGMPLPRALSRQSGRILRITKMSIGSHPQRTQGRPGMPEWTGNIVTAYDFTAGPLKDWGVGGTYQYRSRTAIGYAFEPGSTARDNADVHVLRPSKCPIGLFAYYKFKMPFNGIRARVQLNASGVNMNKNLIPWFATDDGTGHPVVVRYVVGTGTTWNLGVSFDY